MMRYALAYRLGLTPWERYARAAAASTGAPLDREEAERSRPLDRAIDLGCGRGQYTPELARRGWEAVGIDNIPRAIGAANRTWVSGATYVVGDVTDLAPADLGTFDFFFDVGCFQGLNTEQRLAGGRGVSALANPGATLLMLAFQPTRVRSVAGGVTRADVVAAFPSWDMLGRARRHHGAGVAAEQDSAAVVPAPPKGLEHTTYGLGRGSGSRNVPAGTSASPLWSRLCP